MLGRRLDRLGPMCRSAYHSVFEILNLVRMPFFASPIRVATEQRRDVVHAWS